MYVVKEILSSDDLILNPLVRFRFVRMMNENYNKEFSIQQQKGVLVSIIITFRLILPQNKNIPKYNSIPFHNIGILRSCTDSLWWIRGHLLKVFDEPSLHWG